MKLDYEAGILFDSIMAINFHFNHEKWKEMFTKENYENSSLYLEFYDRIKDKLDFIPDHFSPFFYFDKDRTSAATSFFVNEFDRDDKTLKDLLQAIRCDDIFKKSIFKYIFKEKVNLDNKKIIHNKIKGLDISGKYKFDLLYDIVNYGIVKRELISVLIKVHAIILSLHEKYRPYIEGNFESIHKNDIIDLHAKLWKCDIDEIENATVGYSLINKYIISFKKFDNMQFLLGISHLETFMRATTGITASHKNFILACSNDTKYEIIEILMNYEDLSVRQISEKIFESHYTVNKYINELHHESIIEISRQEGGKIYYSINKEYFSVLTRKYSNFIDELRSGRNKKVNSERKEGQ